MRAAVGAAFVAALFLAAPAGAATRAEVRQLAVEAQTDDAALERLRAVREVDGRPYDFRRLLDAPAADRRERLRTLAGDTSSATSSFDAGGEARSIVQDRRFRGSDVPRPFHGFLSWLGEQLRPIVDFVNRVGRHVPGGPWALWVVIALAGVLVSGLTAGKVARDRAALQLERSERAREPAHVDPRALERSAEEAESRGDYVAAVRLRFRAGLLRLGRARVVPLRESLTSGEVRRLLRHEDFDALARTHDEVVFGGRAASGDDATAARERWPRLLAAKGVRA